MKIFLRNALARVLFACWLRVIVPVDPDPEEVAWVDDSVDAFVEGRLVPAPGWQERLMASCTGRELEVWLPLGLERRLRAAVHRMNCDVLAAGWAEEEQFDVDDDLQTVLISAANCGIGHFEQQDGVSYDDTTGLPLETGLLREE